MAARNVPDTDRRRLLAALAGAPVGAAFGRRMQFRFQRPGVGCRWCLDDTIEPHRHPAGGAHVLDQADRGLRRRRVDGA